MFERWWLMARLRLRALLRRDVVDREVDDELRQHVERRIEAEIAGGMPPDRARLTALRAMDGLLQQKERSRDMSGLALVDSTIQDIRYGLRGLRKHPGFAVASVLTIALGIGANTLVFSVVDSLVLSPFPYPEQERLVGVGSGFPRLGASSLGNYVENLSPAEYLDISTRSRALTDVVAWDMGNRQIAELGVENVFTAFWWGDAFPTLGVRPVVGRGFTDDEIANHDRVAILSHRVWQTRLGGDAAIGGSTIHVNGVPHTVVGVMPPRTLIYGTDLWIPMQASPDAYPRPRRQFQLLARLAPGVSLAQANVELDTIARAVEREHVQAHEEYEGWRLEASTWRDINVRTLRPVALLLLGSTIFVLLMVCANLANVLLARFTTRGREMTIRAALGAGRGRLARQLIVESLLLAVAGGALGLLLAIPAVQAASQLLARVPAVSVPDIAINARVMLATLGVSMLFAFLVGAAPALRAFRTDAQTMLRSGGPSATSSPSRLRLQRLLVGVQVALAVLLLTGSGLLIHSLVRLQTVSPGFPTERLLTMRLTLPAEQYPARQRGVFFQELARRVEGLPGVERSAATSQFPPNAFVRAQIMIEGRSVASEEALPAAFLTVASAGYFETLGLPLLRGRLFGDDREEHPPVAVVNQAAADRLFGGNEALGQRLRTDPDAPWIEVVGIVATTRNRGLDVPGEPEIFLPLAQRLGDWNQLYVVTRTSGDPGALIPSIRDQVRAMDSGQPIYAVRTVDDVFASMLGARRVAAAGLGVFAMFALLLAAVGVYGVVSYGVSARVREMGIRMALGASGHGIRSLILRQAALPVLAGLGVGLLGALGLGRLMSGLLFDVQQRDPLTLVAVVLTMLGTAAAAVYVPARRAGNVDPARVLRND